MLDTSRQGSFLLMYTSYMIPLTYLKQTLGELKQVTWPSQKATLRLTVLVIVLSLVVGAYVGLLDFSFTNLLKFLLS